MSRKQKKLIGLTFVSVFCIMIVGANSYGDDSRTEFSFPPDRGGTIPVASYLPLDPTGRLLGHGAIWKQGEYEEEDTESQIATPHLKFSNHRFYDCKYTDLRLFTVHDGNWRWGIKFRLIVPENLNPNIEYPLYLSFAYKATEQEYPHPNLMEIAEEGIIVATTSMRGHVHAYKKGDPLYGKSDWKGPEEMMDFDCLLWCLINGYILEDFPRINPARIGIGGASMGGITTIMYGRKTQIPDATGYKFQVALPGGCAPSMGDWFEPGFDPPTMGDWYDPSFDPSEWLDMSSIGASRLSGLAVQVAAFWDKKPSVTSKATGGSEYTLEDALVHFPVAGVAIDDILYNLKDRSRGIITGVDPRLLTIVDGMTSGANSPNDQYIIFSDWWDKIVDWMEKDANGDYQVTPAEFQKFLDHCAYRSGYDNYRDGYENVTITGDGMVPGFIDNVARGLLRMGCQDSVIPRSPIYDFYKKLTLSASGDAEDGSDTTLIDADAFFETIGIKPGEIIFNTTKGSQGIITAVNSETMLTTDGMSSGANETGDLYYIHRNRFNLISPVGFHLGKIKLVDGDGYMSLPPAENDYGYFPRCSVNMMSNIEGWSFTKAKEYLVHYLVSPLLYPHVANMPDWLFMLVDETLETPVPVQLPTIYTGPPPAHGNLTAVKIFYLKQSHTPNPLYGAHELSGTLPADFSWDIDFRYWPPYEGFQESDFEELTRGCHELDLEELCKPKISASDATIFFSPPLENDFLIIGMPQLRIHCTESTGQQYSFTAILGEMTTRCMGTATGEGLSTTLIDTSADFLTQGVKENDIVYNMTDGSRGTVANLISTTSLAIKIGMSSGENDDGDDYTIMAHDRFWPVTSERCFQKTDTGTMHTHFFEMDMAVHRFKQFNNICLILSPISLPLSKHSMFCHNMHDYNLRMYNNDNGVRAALYLPKGSANTGDPVWQIKESDYIDFIWVEEDEWGEAVGETNYEKREQREEEKVMGEVTRTWGSSD